MTKRINLNKEELYELYHNQGKSSRELEAHFCVEKSTILRNLKRYGFDRHDGNSGWNKGLDKTTNRFVNRQAQQMIGNQNSLTNGLGVANRISPQKIKEIGSCEVCNTTEDLVMHHKDINHANNSDDNLQVLCRSCHGKEHGDGSKFWKFDVLEDEIVSIEPTGVEITYDLTMEKWSNFVANKFIVHNCGKHAGAVVITAKPVTEIIPVMRSAGKKDNEDEYAELQTQWDKKQLESVGIHKYDILGLTTLTTLNKLEKLTGVKALDIPMDDPKTWHFLQEARFMEGVFQLSSPQMKGWCRQIIPNYKKGMTGLIDYLSDINAINRPAVLDAGMGTKYVDNMRQGYYDLPFDYPFIRKVLDSTHGVILYQEQVIYLAKEIAGFSLGKGDLLRRNLENMGTAGKRTEKVVKENEQFKQDFIDGTRKHHGLGDDISNGLWNWLCDSSGYGFNRSHSWTYSLIGYWTAYYKSNYAMEFYATTLNESLERVSAKDNPTEKILREAQNYGIKISLPSCSNSYVNCTIVDNGIVFGLNMVKGLSEKVAEYICSQKWQDFNQFCDYVLTQPKLNKKHVQILLKLGYFDELPGSVYDKWKLYQLKVWKKANDAKEAEWQEKKNAGRKVREFNDLKFEEEPLEGNQKDWVVELLGFEFETRLMKSLTKIPNHILNDDDYIVGEVTNIKTGMKNGRTWCLVTLNTQQGEKKGFLKNAAKDRLYKTEVIYCNYSMSNKDTYSFYNITKIV